MTNQTATKRLTEFHRLVQLEVPRFKKQAETLQGAMMLLNETGASHISGAILQAAKREAIRKGASL